MVEQDSYIAQPPKLTSEPTWVTMLTRVRAEAATAIEYGQLAAKTASLIALAGLLYWCPRCGMWMSEGSEGKGEVAPNANVLPPPRRLLRAISSPLLGNPTPAEQQPKRDGNKLTQNSGVLEGYGMFRGVVSKVRHRPPSDAHGRKVENLYGGRPKPDSRPHAHEASFVRGDGQAIPLYDRLKDGTLVYENDASVTFQASDGSYIWTRKPSSVQPNTEGGG